MAVFLLVVVFFYVGEMWRSVFVPLCIEMKKKSVFFAFVGASSSFSWMLLFFFSQYFVSMVARGIRAFFS